MALEQLEHLGFSVQAMWQGSLDSDSLLIRTTIAI